MDKQRSKLKILLDFTFLRLDPKEWDYLMRKRSETRYQQKGTYRRISKILRQCLQNNEIWKYINPVLLNINKTDVLVNFAFYHLKNQPPRNINDINVMYIECFIL